MKGYYISARRPFSSCAPDSVNKLSFLNPGRLYINLASISPVVLEESRLITLLLSSANRFFVHQAQ